MATTAPSRPSGPTKKPSTMRPPPVRPGANRAQTATPTLTGRASPTESIASSKSRTPKRKAASEMDDAGQETNINVVVRCRGRNDREVRENSGVVVSTEGVKGKKVELSMGPSALSNKTYQFDKVFSPAADQGMLFEEVVVPILDEVLAGFNCTIFAYGQTGTGKTYTMSGDIADTLPIPDAAGIIPRALHSLFARLSEEDAEKCEYSVKCSFIELYNEELRDLLAADGSSKLKIFDEANKNGRSTTLVQGMEESHIKSAPNGIRLLREGSHKRQVAATQCNDLSSRSHTVFTVTVYMKRTAETGEEFVSAGKLNLVDLAGSENIQRSGAENKRAAEAGLINKSLLTLGRVINALVDKSSHIPYRESKLTRLLQDSLGGRTKTCIIATLSPAKSNLEETISTLDYAFRAKNIRNKPQINQMVSKKTLLREFTAEIEKLKSELIATRQRNGVYLTTESYEEITTESESRRILAEEQKDRIDTIEANLRNKVQELFTLTTNSQMMKRDTEQTRMMLEGTKSVLEKTEIVLAHTRQSLAEENELRKAHQQTEEKLAAVGEDLLGTLGTTTDHVDRLHSKLRRRSDLQSVNRSKWAESQSHVFETTSVVDERLHALRGEQESLLSAMTGRMRTFVTDELQELQSSQTLLSEKSTAFLESEAEVNAQTSAARDEMNHVLEEISTLREDVKQKVGAGLTDLSSAAQRISAGIAGELDVFHSQLQDSYVSLGKEFKGIFDGLIKRMNEQQGEAERLRQQIAQANASFLDAGRDSQHHFARAIDTERQTAAANKRTKTAENAYHIAQQTYGSGMDAWNTSAHGLVESSIKSRDAVKTKLKGDWSRANDQTTKLQQTTNAVHSETVRIVDGQMAQMDSQLSALDDVLSRVRAQNDEHHVAHTRTFSQLAGGVQESYSSIGKHFETSYQRVKTLDGDISERAGSLQSTLADLAAEGDVRQALDLLRSESSSARIAEYVATGETPAKTQYSYTTTLPRTEAHQTLLNRMRGIETRPSSPTKRSPSKLARASPSKPPSSPSKTTIFTDTPPTNTTQLHSASAPATRPTPSASASANPSLRELDANAAITSAAAAGLAAPPGTLPARPTISLGSGGAESGAESKVLAPSLKRQQTNPLERAQGGALESKVPSLGGRGGLRATIAGVGRGEGRENVPPSSLLGGGSGGGVGAGGRRLRSRGSD
ncbi:Kinesin-related motor protein [Rachicladosporium monterosium]|uniref:Kinesin-related motor protein n=1 Tax=Rachicladosporium monterosium TaxID=1507873 RepID=A0ABR0L8M3_9PEZI|nr:Kinesin-related motor protein [Rachicladosporium monterosium]